MTQGILIANYLNTRAIFRSLLIYRWLSLIPVILAMIFSDPSPHWDEILGVVIIVNLLITMFSTSINAVLIKKPWLLILDLVFCGGLFSLTNGWLSPYYLYALSPLLVAAFFFKLRGALIVSTILSAIYFATGFMTTPIDVNISELLVQFVGFFLLAATFGYATLLLKRLETSLKDLQWTHQDLEVIYSLTSSLQSAADVKEVQERVLNAITNELGFPRAIMGLVDQDDWVISSWVGKSKNTENIFLDEASYTTEIPLREGAGEIAEAILQGQPHLIVKNITTPDVTLNRILGSNTFHIFPMILREHPVGVLVIGGSEIENTERMESLKSITSQAAVAIGTTLLCIDRAKRLAVQEERVRIAREIHDTVSQSLFGLSFALDACVKLLPDNPEPVKNELILITQLAEKTRRQIRQSILDIWPAEITAETFAHDLHEYTHDFCYCDDLDLTIRVRGPFQQLSSRTRRGLYRVAQEGITNIVRHSAATEALVCLTVIQDEVGMIIRDNGRGFDVTKAFVQEHHPEHFGLSGIQERVKSLNGEIEFLSQSEVGTAILIVIPVDEVQIYG
jgi:signal transduction histidine kinase